MYTLHRQILDLRMDLRSTDRKINLSLVVQTSEMTFNENGNTDQKYWVGAHGNFQTLNENSDPKEYLKRFRWTFVDEQVRRLKNDSLRYGSGTDNFLNMQSNHSGQDNLWWAQHTYLSLFYANKNTFYLTFANMSGSPRRYICEVRPQHKPVQQNLPTNPSSIWKHANSNYEYLAYQILDYTTAHYSFAEQLCKTHGDQHARLGTYKNFEEHQFLIWEVLQDYTDKYGSDVYVILNNFKEYWIT